MKKENDDSPPPYEKIATITTSTIPHAPTPALTWRDKRQRNQRESPMYCLPTKVLRQIFEGSDFLSQQMIRQTCSRFASIISGLNINGTRKDRASRPFDQQFDTRQVWPCHGSLNQRNAIRKQWAALVRRDITDLCSECRHFEESGLLDDRLIALNKKRYCHGCSKSHKRGLFMPYERNNPVYYGDCIGRRTNIRMCPHVELSWKTYRKMINSRLHHNRPGVDLPQISCPKGCHWEGCANSLPLKNMKKNEERNQDTLSPTYASVLRDEQNTQPKLTAVLTWANRLFDVDVDSQTKSISLFKKFLNTVDTHKSGPYLCPHMRFNDGQLLRPLQAPYCTCFPDDDDDEDGDRKEHKDVPYDVQPHKHSGACKARCRCFVEQHSVSSVSSSGQNTQNTAGFLGGHPGGQFQHIATCMVCDARVCWRRQGNAVHLEYANTVTATSPTDGAWIRSLDPHSWGITKDKESKHVYWCPNKSCRTNHQWNALYRRLGL